MYPKNPDNFIEQFDSAEAYLHSLKIDQTCVAVSNFDVVAFQEDQAGLSKNIYKMFSDALSSWKSDNDPENDEKIKKYKEYPEKLREAYSINNYIGSQKSPSQGDHSFNKS